MNKKFERINNKSKTMMIHKFSNNNRDLKLNINNNNINNNKDNINIIINSILKNKETLNYTIKKNKIIQKEFCFKKIFETNKENWMSEYRIHNLVRSSSFRSNNINKIPSIKEIKIYDIKDFLENNIKFKYDSKKVKINKKNFKRNAIKFNFNKQIKNTNQNIKTFHLDSKNNIKFKKKLFNIKFDKFKSDINKIKERNYNINKNIKIHFKTKIN